MDAPTENFLESDVVEAENLHIEKQPSIADLGAGGTEKRWPGWPGDSVFRILVPAHKVGSIIGKKGDYIKRMCEESKSRIKILDAPPGVPERAVMISAKEEPDASVSPAMDGLLRVHRRVVDGLDGGATYAPNAGNKVPTRLLVANTQARILIGKQGSTIKSIQESSSSVVRILEELPPVALPDDRVVEIVGDPAGMHKAIELIANYLRKFLVDHSILNLFEKNMLMQHPPIEPNIQHNMPPQHWGPQGRTPNAGGPGYGPSPQFMPARPHDNFYPQQDFPPIENRPHHGISTYGRDAQPMGFHPSTNQPPAMASQATNYMQIPLSYADAVIGAAGSNISYIRRTSGATVTIQESRGAPGEMAVEIIGSATQVQTAQQLIQNFMAGAAAAGPASGQAPPSAAHNSMASADQGYSSYPAHGHGHSSYPAHGHGPVYGSPASAPVTHTGGGYGSAYGTSYGY